MFIFIFNKIYYKSCLENGQFCFWDVLRNVSKHIKIAMNQKQLYGQNRVIIGDGSYFMWFLRCLVLSHQQIYVSTCGWVEPRLKAMVGTLRWQKHGLKPHLFGGSHLIRAKNRDAEFSASMQCFVCCMDMWQSFSHEPMNSTFQFRPEMT